MRITFLTPADNLTGGSRVVAVHARKLVERGHDVTVVSCAPDRLRPGALLRALARRDWAAIGSHVSPPPGHVALSGVPHKVLKRPGPIRAGDLEDADIVVATWWETVAWMHAMPASKGRRMHLIQGYETWLAPQCRPQVHAALRLPNRKVAISHGLKQTIEDALGPLGISVVPNAVDPDQFAVPPRARQPAPTVGFIYAHAAIKGADICAAACALARRRLPDLKVVAFGADPVSGILPLPDGAVYHHRPNQRMLREIYGSADWWLFGSRLDSFGLPILEAMACGTPVIGVPVGAAPALLDGECGVLLADHSVEAMAAAIVALAQEPPAAWQARSRRAHDRAHGYSWDDASDMLLEIMNGMMRQA